jgi:hypothetical protein
MLHFFNVVVGTNMDFFATKACYGIGPQFDPILEEKGDWIFGETQQQDVEMSDTMIEVLVRLLKVFNNNNCQPEWESRGQI